MRRTNSRRMPVMTAAVAAALLLAASCGGDEPPPQPTAIEVVKNLAGTGLPMTQLSEHGGTGCKSTTEGRAVLCESTASFLDVRSRVDGEISSVPETVEIWRTAELARASAAAIKAADASMYPKLPRAQVFVSGPIVLVIESFTISQVRRQGNSRYAAEDYRDAFYRLYPPSSPPT
jgi:hypothetical protein